MLAHERVDSVCNPFHLVFHQAEKYFQRENQQHIGISFFQGTKSLLKNGRSQVRLHLL
jgi:hypothetical protein